MARKKITVVVGTRPEVIRLSEIIKLIDKNYELRLVHTGQNQQPYLSKVFFEELEIRKPDLILNLNNESLGKFIGELFPAIESELKLNPPDAILVLGDTNSALSAFVAKRMGIVTYHLEAGNRSYDQNVPEEINRRVVDHLADYNLSYTTHARNNLLAEGLHPRNSIVIGSPLFEVIRKYRKSIDSSNILQQLGITKGRYFLVSAHRQENIDKTYRLQELCETLNQLARRFGDPVICSLHPRLRSRLKTLNFIFEDLINLQSPFSFMDYCNLQLNARVVLSDSGSVSEEASILGFKAVTIRDSMERPEALESGTVVISGLRSNEVLSAIDLIESANGNMNGPPEYLIENTSYRVVNFIESSLGRHRFWTGIRE